MDIHGLTGDPDQRHRVWEATDTGEKSVAPWDIDDAWFDGENRWFVVGYVAGVVRPGVGNMVPYDEDKLRILRRLGVRVKPC